MVPTVEQKLSAHFGAPVTLILDLDDSTPPSAGAGGAGAAPAKSSEPPSAGAAGRAADSDDDASEYADYAEAPDAGEQALEAEARLLQAFPGASEVSG
jgi:hypothetical protein